MFCKSPEGPALQKTGFSGLLCSQSAALYVTWLCRALLSLWTASPSVEGFSECTARSGLTFGVHSYWRQELKRFFLKDAGLSPAHCQGPSTFPFLLFFMRFSLDAFVLCLKGRTAVGWSHPNKIQLQGSEAEKIKIVPQGPLLYLLYLSLEMRHLGKEAGLKRMPL